MVVYVKDTNLLDDTAGSTLLSLGTGDALFVLRSVAVMQTNLGKAVQLNGFGINIFIEGSVSGGLHAIADDLALQTNNYVHIAATGFVASVASTAIALTGLGARVDNTGTIASPVIGVSFAGAKSSLVNTGTVSGNQTAVQAFGTEGRIDNSGVISGGGAGIGLFGSGSALINSGTITGVYGAYVGADNVDIANTATGRVTSSGGTSDTAAAVAVTSAASFHLHNAGLLEGLGVSALRIAARFTGVPDATSTVATVINDGTISATEGPAILLLASSAGDQVGLNLVNTGKIIGDVTLVGGADRYDGEGGRLLGVLSAGAGDDTLAGGTGRETLRGESGNDSLEGGDGRDSVDGGTENDTIEGGAGADTLAGGLGLDTLVYTGSAAGVIIDLDSGEAAGGEATGDTVSGFERVLGSHFNDDLAGAATSDTLDGAAGNDLLAGAGGADQLSGRRGEDTLIGGGGADTLSGGGGADLFLYLALGDTGTSNNGRHRITDFNAQDGDRISLAAIDANDTAAGDQAFVFIGTAAFTGAGQLRYVPGTTTLIEGNVSTADVTADFRIVLSSSVTLTGSEFLL